MACDRTPTPAPGPIPSAVEPVTGTRSVEQLHHFQCGVCRKWWSIGDAPERAGWYCPWCGRENRFR